MNKHNALLSKLPFWGSCEGFLFSLLLLLLLVSACSDEGREMAEIQQGADEVELTIRTEISGMKNNARTTITDAVNSIVALAFDESDALIKKVDAVLTKEENSTSGTLKIKVPKRTRSIHFLGNYTKNDITDITTIDDLKALTTDDMTTMHYWGTTTFDGSNANLPVILYRNMAKVTLTLGNDLTGYIAGFVNYNTTGTVVPNGFTVGDTPTIPTEVDTNTHQEDNSLDTEHYLFEHPNVEDTNPLFVIVEILDKYYKVAFATKANDVLTYFPIVRNRAYNITINSVEESLGGTYKEALAADPINDVVIEEKTVTILAVPSASTLNYAESSVEDLLVNVTIPAGVTTLYFSSDYFEVVFINSTSITDNGNGSYSVTGGAQISTDVRLRLKNKTETQNAGFTFSGAGDNLNVTPVEVNNITLQANGDEYVRWQGDAELNYSNDAVKIVLPYSWFEGLSAGSKLRVEYEILSTGPIIQFSEVYDEWDNPGFHFPELETTQRDDNGNETGTLGCNLTNNKSDSGYWIYGTNESAFTGEASFDLTLSQDVLDVMAANRRTELFGEKDIVIAIQGENVTLKSISVIPAEDVVFDIELDFYTESEGANGGSGQYINNNLVFGETNFYLKATIPNNVPADKKIILNRTVTGVNGIHQYYSYNPDKSNGINYSFDSNEISFTTVAEKTEYWICWTYVRSDNTQTGNVNVSYSLTSSDESLYTLSGETSANITITGNHPQQIKVAVNGGESSGRVDTSLEYTKNATNQLTVTVTVPEEVTELTIEPGDFDVSWTDANENTISGTSFTFATGVITQDFTLTLKEASKVVKENSIVTFRYAPDRFVAAGVVAVDLTEKVVDDAVVFDLDFNSGDEGFYKREDGSGSVSASDGALVLKNTEDRTNAWDAQAMYATDDIEYGATYTLTFKAKIDEGTTGGLVVAIQSGGGSYTYYYVGKNINDIFNNVQKDDQGWAEIVFDNNINITNSETQDNPTHFMFNFGDLVGTIYIDDLKLVKND